MSAPPLFNCILISVAVANMFGNRVFNTGSPFNVAPGSQADLSKIAAHYHKKNQDLETDRLARTKDGKVVSIYD